MHWTYSTCTKCGETFRYLTDGFKIKTRCDKCVKNSSKEILEYTDKIEELTKKIKETLGEN